jgi:hypothetical protein
MPATTAIRGALPDNSKPVGICPDRFLKNSQQGKAGRWMRYRPTL